MTSGLYFGDTELVEYPDYEGLISNQLHEKSPEIDPFPWQKASYLFEQRGITPLSDGFGDSGEHIIDRDGTTAIWWCIEGIRLTDNSRGFFTIFSHLPGKVLETENCPSFVLEYIHNNLNDNSH